MLAIGAGEVVERSECPILPRVEWRRQHVDDTVSITAAVIGGTVKGSGPALYRSTIGQGAVWAVEVQDDGLLPQSSAGARRR